MFYNKRIFKRCFNHGWRYWYKNIKEIPLYFKLMHHLIKHGYDEYATWEIDGWFIYTMKHILTTYDVSHKAYPVVSFDDPVKQKEFEKKYDEELHTMISLLDDMCECSPKYENYDVEQILDEMTAAKDKFFELFSKHFYSLWY